MSTSQPANRISFNADAQFLGERETFLTAAERLQPDFITILNDFPEYKLCDELHRRSPNTQIIHRRWFPDGNEGRLHRIEHGDDKHLMTPEDFLKVLQDNNRPYLLHNVMNEPAPKGDDLRACLKWLIELMKLAKAADMRLVVGNFQCVAYNQAEIESGDWDDYFRALYEYRGFHYAGWHEYFTGILPAGCGGLSHEILVMPGALPFEQWADERAFRTFIYRHSDMGRYLWFDERARKIGAYPIDKIFTEIGWDQTIRTGTVFHRLNDLCGQEAQGIVTLGKLWRAHYPQWTQEEAAYQQLLWLDRVYDSTVKAFCVFGWNVQSEWEKFNVGLFKGLHERMIQYAHERRLKPPAPEPTPAPKPETPTPAEPTPTPEIPVSVRHARMRAILEQMRRELMELDGLLQI